MDDELTSKRDSVNQLMDIDQPLNAQQNVHSEDQCLCGLPRCQDLKLSQELDLILNPSNNFTSTSQLEKLWSLLSLGHPDKESFLNCLNEYRLERHCGLSWPPGYVGYRCRTCSDYHSMSLCADCFRDGNHQGHDYNMFKSGGGGACDCGSDYVKAFGHCKRHGNNACSPRSSEQIPESLMCIPRRMMPRIIHWLAIQYRQKVGQSLEPDVFMNFVLKIADSSAVLRAIIVEILLSEDCYSGQWKTLTDHPNETFVQLGHKSRKVIKYVKKKLVSPKIPRDWKVPTRSINAFCDNSQINTFLDEFILWNIFYQMPQNLVCFITSFMMDNNYKQKFARTFVNYYPHIAMYLVEMASDTTPKVRETHEQISTRVILQTTQINHDAELMRKLCEEEMTLHTLIYCLRMAIEGKLSEDTPGALLINPLCSHNLAPRPKVISRSHAIISERRLRAFTDNLEEILILDHVAESLIKDKDLLNIWLEMLCYFQTMNPFKRELNEHLPYEANPHIYIFLLEAEFCLIPFWSILSHFNDESHSSHSLALLESIHHNLAKWLHKMSIGPFSQLDANHVSLHIPVHRMLSAIIRHILYIQNKTDEEVYRFLERNQLIFGSKYTYRSAHGNRIVIKMEDFLKMIILHPLQALSFYHQTKSNMWTRNGPTVINQAATYNNCIHRYSTIDLDMFLLRYCASKMKPDTFLKLMMQRFYAWQCLSFISGQVFSDSESSRVHYNYNIQPEQLAQLVECCLITLIQLLTLDLHCNISEREQKKQKLIAVLSVADRPYSFLLDVLPERSMLAQNKPNDHLNELIEELTIYKPAKHGANGNLHHGCYTLKPSVWDNDYNPIQILYLYYPRRDYQLSLDRFYQVSRSTGKLDRRQHSSTLWPPLQIPRSIGNFGQLDLGPLVECQSILGVVFSLLYKSLYVEELPDSMLAYTIHLLELALRRSLSGDDRNNSMDCDDDTDDCKHCPQFDAHSGPELSANFTGRFCYRELIPFAQYYNDLPKEDALIKGRTIYSLFSEDTKDDQAYKDAKLFPVVRHALDLAFETTWFPFKSVLDNCLVHVETVHSLTKDEFFTMLENKLDDCGDTSDLNARESSACSAPMDEDLQFDQQHVELATSSSTRSTGSQTGWWFSETIDLDLNEDVADLDDADEEEVDLEELDDEDEDDDSDEDDSDSGSYEYYNEESTNANGGPGRQDMTDDLELVADPDDTEQRNLSDASETMQLLGETRTPRGRDVGGGSGASGTSGATVGLNLAISEAGGARNELVLDYASWISHNLSIGSRNNNDNANNNNNNNYAAHASQSGPGSGPDQQSVANSRSSQEAGRTSDSGTNTPATASLAQVVVGSGSVALDELPDAAATDSVTSVGAHAVPSAVEPSGPKLEPSCSADGLASSSSNPAREPQQQQIYAENLITERRAILAANPRPMITGPERPLALEAPARLGPAAAANQPALGAPSTGPTSSEAEVGPTSGSVSLVSQRTGSSRSVGASPSGRPILCSSSARAGDQGQPSAANQQEPSGARFLSELDIQTRFMNFFQARPDLQDRPAPGQLAPNLRSSRPRPMLRRANQRADMMQEPYVLMNNDLASNNNNNNRQQQHEIRTAASGGARPVASTPVPTLNAFLARADMIINAVNQAQHQPQNLVSGLATGSPGAGGAARSSVGRRRVSRTSLQNRFMVQARGLASQPPTSPTRSPPNEARADVIINAANQRQAQAQNLISATTTGPPTTGSAPGGAVGPPAANYISGSTPTHDQQQQLQPAVDRSRPTARTSSLQNRFMAGRSRPAAEVPSQLFTSLIRSPPSDDPVRLQWNPASASASRAEPGSPDSRPRTAPRSARHPNEPRETTRPASSSARKLRKEYRQHHGESIATLLLRLHAKYSRSPNSYQFDAKRARENLSLTTRRRLGDATHFVTLALDLICAQELLATNPGAGCSKPGLVASDARSRLDHLRQLIWPPQRDEFCCEAGPASEPVPATATDPANREAELSARVHQHHDHRARVHSATPATGTEYNDLKPTAGNQPYRHQSASGIDIQVKTTPTRSSGTATGLWASSSLGAAGYAHGSRPNNSAARSDAAGPRLGAPMTPDERRRLVKERQSRLMAEFASKQQAFMDKYNSSSGLTISAAGNQTATRHKVHQPPGDRGPGAPMDLKGAPAATGPDKIQRRHQALTLGAGCSANQLQVPSDEQPINLSAKSSHTAGPNDGHGGPEMSDCDKKLSISASASSPQLADKALGSGDHPTTAPSDSMEVDQVELVGRQEEKDQQQQQHQSGARNEQSPLESDEQLEEEEDELEMETASEGGAPCELECCICGLGQTGADDLTNPLGLVVLLQSSSIFGHSHMRPSHERQLPCNEDQVARLKSLMDETYARHLENRIYLLCEHFSESSRLDSINIGAEGGVHVQSCGHYLHIECHQSYIRSLDREDRLRARFDQDDFLCPVCRQLANSVLPILSGGRARASSGLARSRRLGAPRSLPELGDGRVASNGALACEQMVPNQANGGPGAGSSTNRQPGGSQLDHRIALIGQQLGQRCPPNQLELQSSASFCAHLTKATGPQHRLVRSSASMHSLFLFLASIARTNLESALIVRQLQVEHEHQELREHQLGHQGGASSSQRPAAAQRAGAHLDQRRASQEAAGSIQPPPPTTTNRPAPTKLHTCLQLLFHVLALNAQTLINDQWFSGEQIWSHLTHRVDERNRLSVRPTTSSVPLLLRDPVAMLLQFLLGLARPTVCSKANFACLVRVLFNLVVVQSIATLLSRQPTEPPAGPGGPSWAPGPASGDGTQIGAGATPPTGNGADKAPGRKSRDEAADGRAEGRDGSPTTPPAGQLAGSTFCPDGSATGWGPGAGPHFERLVGAVRAGLGELAAELADLDDEPLTDSGGERAPAPRDANQASQPSRVSAGRLASQVKLASLHFLKAAALLQEQLFGGPGLPRLELARDERLYASSPSGVAADFRALTASLGLLRAGPSEQSAGGASELVAALWWPAAGAERLAVSWSAELARFWRQYPLAASALTVRRPLAWYRPALMRLPHAFDDLFMFYYRKKCSLCQQVPKDIAVCLVCGAPICFRVSCCKDRSRSRQVHSQHCGASTAVFLAVHTSAVVVIRGSRACVWGSVYLDDHEEEDHGLLRGKPLHLVAARFRLLERQWLSHSFDHTCGKRWIYLQEDQ